MNETITENTFRVPIEGLNHIAMFEIYVVHCNLVKELVETETDPKVAARKYTDLLVEAIVPSSTEGKHVRVLQLAVKDHDNHVIAFTNNGPFPCNHLTTGKEPGTDEKEDDE